MKNWKEKEVNNSLIFVSQQEERVAPASQNGEDTW